MAEQAASRKDLPHLEEILLKEQVAKIRARAILETPGLYGKQEVLRRGRMLAGRDPHLRRPLDRLTQVYELLTASGLPRVSYWIWGSFADSITMMAWFLKYLPKEWVVKLEAGGGTTT